MRALLLSFAAVFGLTMAARPTMGAGWFWDAGNGLGFAAFAGLLYLMITSSRRLDVRAHQLLGYVVLLLAVLHVFWLLLGDPAVGSFVKFGAPDYMWLGVVGILLLAALVLSALLPDRPRIHRDYASFRYWHEVLAVACLAACAYHILGSGFYLGRWYQLVLFAVFVAAAIFGREKLRQYRQMKIAAPPVLLLVSLACVAAFTVLRNLPA